MSHLIRSSRSVPPARLPRQSGQASPLVAVAVLLAAVVVLALVTQASATVAAARARTAADAAALAGAAEGPVAAERLARANGGRLLALEVEGDDVVVEVSVDGTTAGARARRDGTWCSPDTSTGPSISYTSPPCPSSPG